MNFLIPSLLLLLTGALALAEDRPRIFTELREAMTAESSAWTPAEVEELGVEVLRWRFVKTWKLAELEIAARNGSFGEDDSWWTPVIKRWGMLDHESALSFFLDRLYRARIDHGWPGRVGHFSVRQYFEENAGYALIRIFAGWARSDPKGAWRHLIDLESEHRKMGLFQELVHRESFLIPEVLGPLVKLDPDFVVSEFQRAGLCEELGMELRPLLLAGLAEGLSDETDWAALFGRLENELRHGYHRTLRVAQGPLFGRWLQTDPKAAEAWFESEASQAVFRGAKRLWWREGNREFQVNDEIIPLDEPPLIRAAHRWLVESPEDAVRWFQDHRNYLPALLKKIEGRSPKAGERRSLRRLLVFCLHKTERESLIRGMMADRCSSFRRSLRIFVTLEHQAKLQEELAELDLNDDFIPEIMEALETADKGDGAFGEIHIHIE